MKKTKDYSTLSKFKIMTGTIVVAGVLIVLACLFLCRDQCTCPTGGPYAFAGAFEVAAVQGNQRRVDPIFSTTACCSESCCVVLSRCNTTTVNKIVAAPDALALTNAAGVPLAQAQITAAIAAGNIAPPAFVGTDCP